MTTIEDRPLTEPSAIEDRAIGALLGLAIGDAIGTTLEFRARDTYQPLTDMVGGGPFNLKAGGWTDDTAMALVSPTAWTGGTILTSKSCCADL
jgi:ADP-ribosyl-[dinitrogen reductase] hydrolase